MALSSSTEKAQLCTAENREKPCFEQHVREHMEMVGLHRYVSGMGFSSGCYKPDKHTPLLFFPLLTQESIRK